MHKLYERQVVGLALIILTALAGIDLLHDIAGGDTTIMVLHDVLNFGIPCGLLLYIWKLEPLKSQRRRKRLLQVAQRQRADLAQLSLLARKQLEGLAVFINAHFENWDLTPAEKEVALLLLKGFSMREIADLRDISERTARQQATAVYGKSGLNGRTGLSAFFLEDLLLPEVCDTFGDDSTQALKIA